MNKQNVSRDLYRKGRREGVAAYLAWKAGSTPMPFEAKIADIESYCSVDHPYAVIQEGFVDGFIWAEDNKFETWG